MNEPLSGAAPAAIVVATMPGSLPMGGVVADTPIHALQPGLALAPQPGLRPRRSDIDLGGLLAFTIDAVLTAVEAERMAAAAQALGYRDAAPGIRTAPGMRMNKSVHWVADERLLGAIHTRIAPLLPPELDGERLHGRLSHRINMYRYARGDVFNRHTDGDWPGFGLDAGGLHMVQWPPHLRSKLTMLLYLNGPDDGVEGGHTQLFGADGRIVDVVPAKGAALFFRHGFGPGSVMHVGARVTGDVAKVVARINVMYESPGHAAGH
jgi:2OG-Fe(II) oxygenase superfamily